MRDTLNRIFVVLFLIVCMVGCSILLVGPEATEVFAGRIVAVEDVLDNIAAGLPVDLGWVPRVAVGVLFAVALDFVLFLILLIELRRPKAKAIKVDKAGGGEVEVSIDSISDRLTYELSQLPGVLRIKPAVSAKGGGVLVKLDVQTVAGVNVPEKADQILEKTRQVVEDQLGISLARPPKINLHAMSHARSGREPIRPRPVDRPVEAPPREKKAGEPEAEAALGQSPEAEEEGDASFPLIGGDPHDLGE